MQKIVILHKKLEAPSDGSQYVANLETVVNDLFSTSFKKVVRLFNNEQDYVSYYDINYGTITRKDKSGVPQKEYVWGCDVFIKTLQQLRRNIRKAKKSEKPDFKIQYKEINLDDNRTFLEDLFGPPPRKVSKGTYGRVEKIELHEDKSSTYISARLDNNGLIEIQFRYDLMSSKRELARIDKSITMLIKREYRYDEKPVNDLSKPTERGCSVDNGEPVDNLSEVKKISGVDKNSVYKVRQEFAQNSDYLNEILERMQKDNPYIAKFINESAQNSIDPDAVKKCGCLVYRLYEVGGPLPTVSKDIFAPIIEDIRRTENYLAENLRKLLDEDPIIASLITKFSKISGDPSEVAYTGLVISKSLKSQAAANKLKEEVRL